MAETHWKSLNAPMDPEDGNHFFPPKFLPGVQKLQIFLIFFIKISIFIFCEFSILWDL